MSSSATAVTAWIAFGISVSTFVWKFAETYIRWPRLGITLRQSVSVFVTLNTGADPQPQNAASASGRNQDRFDIVVVNSGTEATTVFNVGLRSVDRSRTIDVEYERDNGTTVNGPDLPARIEAHGALQWTIHHELTSRFPRGTKIVGYAHRYRNYHRFPKWRQNTIRVYETPVEYTKN